MKRFQTKHRWYWALVLFVTGAFCMSSCTGPEPDPVPDTAKVILRLVHRIDSQDLKKNELIYRNEAGYPFSVTRLEYFLSALSLTSIQNGPVYHSQNVHYVDGFDHTTHQLVFQDVPVGNYTELSFNFGLNEMANTSHSLPNTPENIGMAWPESMGGGYHFMKFEGKYEYQSKKLGYAIHLGTNVCTLRIQLPESITIEPDDNSIVLEMNINEWMRKPNTYDFEVDGNYTMGDTTNMQLVRDNGLNVFSIQKQ